ncbi:hypothetical protein EXE43_05430 [Halorubrum sp. SS5]|nr:hypothetical protein EXE43_05430 [Halorubrum sp. SS5]
MKLTRGPFVLAVALLALVAATGGAVAQSSGDDLYESLEEMVPTYNDNVDGINLGPINLAGTSNIYVEDGDSTVTYAVTMDDRNRITGLSESPSDDAVRKITTDRETIRGIVDADDPATAFRDAVANDDIAISGESGQPIEQLKWAVINAFKGSFL